MNNIEYNSENEEVELDTNITEEVTLPTKAVKVKKPRTPAQIATTKKMHEKLKVSRDHLYKLKIEAKEVAVLQKNENNKNLKKRLHKKQINDKAEELFNQKMKEIMEASEDSEDEMVIEHVKPVKPKPVKPKPVKPKPVKPKPVKPKPVKPKAVVKPKPVKAPPKLKTQPDYESRGIRFF